MTNYYLLFFKVYKVLNSSNTPRLLALQLCVLQLCSAPQHFCSPLALSTLALSPPASSPSSLQLITFLTSNRYYFHNFLFLFSNYAYQDFNDGGSLSLMPLFRMHLSQKPLSRMHLCSNYIL